MTDLRPQIQNHLVQEKVGLLDALWESAEDDALPLTDVQRVELDRRVAGYEQDHSDVIPWEQVRADRWK